MVRKSFWEQFVDLEISPFNIMCNTAGFFTWGEVMRNNQTKDVSEYNITLVSTAFKEGDGVACTKPVYINDKKLSGQTLLMSRLTKLVVSTTNELYASYESIQLLNDKLREQNEHDKLTGIYNRGKIEQLILDEVKKDTYTSLIMIDIDHFKSINDTYGHAVGDDVLCSVTKIMSEVSKKIRGSACGRWGGEEFFILLPNTNTESASIFAEELRQKVADFDFNLDGAVTISLGVITSTSVNDANQLFIEVDAALYKAKNTGRNKVIMVCKEEV